MLRTPAPLLLSCHAFQNRFCRASEPAIAANHPFTIPRAVLDAARSSWKSECRGDDSFCR